MLLKKYFRYLSQKEVSALPDLWFTYSSIIDESEKFCQMLNSGSIVKNISATPWSWRFFPTGRSEIRGI